MTLPAAVRWSGQSGLQAVPLLAVGTPSEREVSSLSIMFDDAGVERRRLPMGWKPQREYIRGTWLTEPIFFFPFILPPNNFIHTGKKTVMQLIISLKYKNTTVT